MLIRLRESHIGCHYKQCFTGALAYADDVTIICPILRGINTMLEICNEYAAANHIYFNSIKTECIKYGDPVMKYEKALLNGVYYLTFDRMIVLPTQTLIPRISN